MARNQAQDEVLAEFSDTQVSGGETPLVQIGR